MHHSDDNDCDSSLNMTELMDEYSEIIKKYKHCRSNTYVKDTKSKSKKTKKTKHSHNKSIDNMWFSDECIKNIDTDKLLKNLTGLNQSTSVSDSITNSSNRSVTNSVTSNNLSNISEPKQKRTMVENDDSKKTVSQLQKPQLPEPELPQKSPQPALKSDMQADIFVKYLNKSMKVNADMRSHTDIDLEKNNNFMYFLTKTSMQSLKEKKL